MNKLLTPKQAAEFLGYSQGTLGWSRSTGLLAGVKTPEYIRKGGRVFYDIEVLKAWKATAPTKKEAHKLKYKRRSSAIKKPREKLGQSLLCKVWV